MTQLSKEQAELAGLPVMAEQAPTITPSDDEPEFCWQDPEIVGDEEVPLREAGPTEGN